MNIETKNNISEIFNEINKLNDIITKLNNKLNTISKDIIAKEAVCQEGDTVIMNNTKYKVDLVLFIM